MIHESKLKDLKNELLIKSKAYLDFASACANTKKDSLNGLKAIAMSDAFDCCIEMVDKILIASSDSSCVKVDDFNVGCGDVIRLMNSEYAYCGKEYSGGKKYYCKVCEEKLKSSSGSKAIES